MQKEKEEEEAIRLAAQEALVTEHVENRSSSSNQSREGDSRLYPPSLATTSGNNSTASPPTPGNQFIHPYPPTEPYAAPQQLPQSMLGMPAEGHTDPQFTFGAQHWYPPVHEKDSMRQEYAMPPATTGYENVQRQQHAPDDIVYPQQVYQPPYESEVAPTPQSDAPSQDQLHPSFPPPHDQPLPYHTNENFSSSTTPAQSWAPLNTKLQVSCAILGILIDLFPVTKELHAAMKAELLKHLQTLAVNPHDGMYPISDLVKPSTDGYSRHS